MIESLRAAYDVPVLLVASGFVVGLLFGIVAEITGFCTRAAIVETLDRSPGKVRTRLVQYLAALLTAVLIAQALHLTTTVDLSKSLYWTVPVNIVALTVGGIAFGIGMVLANGCPGRHLVLMSTGSARSLLTLTVLGIASYATLRGVLAYPRIGLEGLSPRGIIPAGLPQLLGIPAHIFAGVVVIALTGGVVWLMRRTGVGAVIGGIAVGGVIGLGWWATGYFAVSEFDPARPASISFTAPIGETVMYIMIATGESVKFNVALVMGVLAGALLGAVVGRRFEVRGFTTELSVLRYGGGAVLMGFGAVLALGCNMGQSLTGLSTLSTGSLIATISIVAGACLMIALDRRYNWKI
jgi:uncharacterized membrane protein YedE/YeeE